MVHEWLKDGIYPDVADIKLGDVIGKCWRGYFKSAKEVAESIEREMDPLTLSTVMPPGKAVHQGLKTLNEEEYRSPLINLNTIRTNTGKESMCCYPLNFPFYSMDILLQLL
jgi:hypothetical protein